MIKPKGLFKHLLTQYLCPDAYVDSVTKIDLPLLKSKGYQFLIVDLDNTLLSWKARDIPESIQSWLSGAQQLGFKLVLVSNSLRKRVNRLSKVVGIPAISRAAKPRKRVFIEALLRIDAKPEQTVVIGDQLFTDILGGKRIGLFTILVAPVDSRELFITAIFRIPERLILTHLLKSGLLKKTLTLPSP